MVPSGDELVADRRDKENAGRPGIVAAAIWGIVQPVSGAHCVGLDASASEVNRIALSASEADGASSPAINDGLSRSMI